MTREDAKKDLINLGIEAPTDEQITSYLNRFNGETQKYKDSAKKVEELTKQLNELNDANLTESERAAKEKATAESKIADLERTIRAMNTKTELAGLGIIGEQAEKLISADGVIDFATLGQIISERETKAISDFEKQSLKDTPNPGGGTGGENPKTESDKVAELVGASLGGVLANKNANNVIDSYL